MNVSQTSPMIGIRSSVMSLTENALLADQSQPAAVSAILGPPTADPPSRLTCSA